MEFGAESDPEMNFNPDYEIASDEEDCTDANVIENAETKDEERPITNDDESEISTESSSDDSSSSSEEEEEDGEDDDDKDDSDEENNKDHMAEHENREAERKEENKKNERSPRSVNHDKISKSSNEISPVKDRTINDFKDLPNISPGEKSKKGKDGELRKSVDNNLDIYADMSMDGADFKAHTHKIKDGDSNLDLYSEFVIEEVSSRPSYDQMFAPSCDMGRKRKKEGYGKLLKDKDVNHLKVEELKSTLHKLMKQEKSIKEENLMLRKNISSLYKTAQAEIKRKDKEIAALVRKLDYLQPMRFQALMYRKIVAARSQGKEGKEFDQILASTLQAKELSSKKANSSEAIQQLEDSLAKESCFQKDGSQERKRQRDCKDEHEEKYERPDKREKRSDSRDKSDRVYKDTREKLTKGRESLPHKRSPTNDGRQRNRGTLSVSPSRKSKDQPSEQYSGRHTNGTVDSLGEARRKEDLKKEHRKTSEEPKVKERRTEDKYKQKEHRRDEPSSSSSKLNKSEKSYEKTTKKEKSSIIDKQVSVKKYDMIQSAERPSKNIGRSSSVDSQRHRRDDHSRKSDKESSKSHSRISLNESRSSSVDRHRNQVKEQEKKGNKDLIKISERTSEKSDQRHRKGIEGRSLDRLSQKERDRELEIQRRIKNREQLRQIGDDKLPPNRTLSAHKDEGKRSSSSTDIDRERKSRSQDSKPDVEKVKMKERKKEDEKNRLKEKEKGKSDETTRRNEKGRRNLDESTRGSDKGRRNTEEMTRGNEKERRNQEEMIRHNEKEGRKPNEIIRTNEKEIREHARKDQHSSNDKSQVTKKEKQLQDSKRSQSSTRSSHLDTHEHSLKEKKHQKHMSRDAVEKTDKKSKRSPVKKVKPHQLPTLRHLEHDDSSSENDSKLISSYSGKSKNHNTSEFSKNVTTTEKTTKNTNTGLQSPGSSNAMNVEVDNISLSDIDSGSDEDSGEYSQTDKSKLKGSKEELVSSMQKESPKKRPKSDDHKHSVKGSTGGSPEKYKNTIQEVKGQKGSKTIKESPKHSKNAHKSANNSSQGLDKLKVTEKDHEILKPSKKKKKNSSEAEKTFKEDSVDKERKAPVENEKSESDGLAKAGPIKTSRQNISEAGTESPSKSKDDRIKKRKRKEKESSTSKVKVKKIKKNNDKQKDIVNVDTPGSPISTEEEKKTADVSIDEKITQVDETPGKEDSQLEEGELSEGEIKSDSESEISPDYFKPTGHRLGRNEERRNVATLGKSKDLRQLINKKDVHKRSKESYRGDKSQRSRSDRY